MTHPLLPLILLALSDAFQIAAATPTSFRSHYLSLGPQDHAGAITADAAGNLFIVATIKDDFGQQALRIFKTDPQGNVVASLDFDRGVVGIVEAVPSVVVDPQGNVLVAATMSTPLYYNVRIVKLDAALTQILATATLGSGTTGSTVSTAIAADAEGNLYVVGNTWATDLPVTPGAYRTVPPPVCATDFVACPPPFGPLLGFAARFSHDLSKVLYATYYGQDWLSCKHCSAYRAVTTITAVLADSTGAATIAGYTDSESSAQGYWAAFIARISPDGGSVTASNTFGNTSRYYLGNSAAINAMAIDPAGNILVAGLLIAGTGIFQFPNSPPQPQWSAKRGFVARFDPDLQNLTAGAYVGGDINLGAPGYLGGVFKIASDADGNIWFTASAPQNSFPGQSSASTLPIPYVAAISSDWTTFLNLTPTQLAGRAITAEPGGGVAVLGVNDSFLTSSPDPQPGILTVANSANNASSGTIAPTELITLYGTGIGPPDPMPGQVVNAAFTKTLAGYQVLFNGTPAPLLYAGPDQFNVVAPLALVDQRNARIQVVGPQGSTDFPIVYVAPARPQIFSYISDSTTTGGASGPNFGRTYAIALNQDGTMNSPTNRASPGSVVTIWVSGAYGTSSVGEPVDGEIVPKQDFPYPSTAVAVGWAGPPYQFLAVQYAADAPSQVLGLTQINVQLPGLYPGSNGNPYYYPYQIPMIVFIGGVPSDDAAIFTLGRG